MSKESIEIDSDVLDSKINLKKTDSIDDILVQIEKYTQSTNLLSVSKDVESLKALFYTKLKSLDDESSEIEKEFKKIYNKYRKERNSIRKKTEEDEKRNLKIKEDIISEIKDLTLNIEIKKETYNKFKELQKKWRETGHVNIRYKNEIWQNYNHFVEVFYDYLRLNNDLRDLDFKKNYKLKIELCEHAESLINEKSLNKMHEELQKLHDKWRNIGPVIKQEREVIWERFQDASRKINKKRNDYYTNLKKKDQEKINSKKDICEQINKIASKEFESYQACDKAKNEIDNLSNKWKSIGRVNKKDNKESWKIFRESLNKFYKKKNNFYKKRKEDNKKIIELKEKLCHQAEKLAQDSNWDVTTKKMITLQKEWKKTGHVFGKTNNDLWARFKKSCDSFFNAKKKHQNKIKDEISKKLKTKEKIISKISKHKISKEIQENILFIENQIKEWIQLGNIGNNSRLENDFKKAYITLLEKLSIDSNEMSKLKNKFLLSLISNNPDDLKKHKINLRQIISEKKKELDLYETNKSFFVSVKKNDPLKKEINLKIEKLSQELQEVKEELKNLNKV